MCFTRRCSCTHTPECPPAAAAAPSVFYLGELVGRAGGAQLARTAGRGRLIIGMALAVTAVGFGAFWLARRPDIAVAGLGVAGLGIANLYPLSPALAIAAAPGRTDQASGRAPLAVAAALPCMAGTLRSRTPGVRGSGSWSR
ncbi:MAG: hypothetical protein ACM3ML_08600 [Micromonosporaceae bacterium]